MERWFSTESESKDLFFHYLLPPSEPLIPYFSSPFFLASLHGPGLFSSRTIGEVRSWSLTRARRYRPDEQPRRLRRHLRRADAPPTRAGFTNRFQIFQHNEADCCPKIPPHAYTLSSSNGLSIAACSPRLHCRPSRGR